MKEKKAVIKISNSTRKWLIKKKLDMDMRSVDEVIRYLIKLEEKQRGET